MLIASPSATASIWTIQGWLHANNMSIFYSIHLAEWVDYMQVASPSATTSIYSKGLTMYKQEVHLLKHPSSSKSWLCAGSKSICYSIHLVQAVRTCIPHVHLWKHPSELQFHWQVCLSLFLTNETHSHRETYIQNMQYRKIRHSMLLVCFYVPGYRICSHPNDWYFVWDHLLWLGFYNNNPGTLVHLVQFVHLNNL